MNRRKFLKIAGSTGAGREMRLRCVESVGPLLAQLAEELSDKEIETILPVLEKIRKYLDSHRS